MSGYTSGNNAPTQMAQAPNRVGNKSKDPVTGKGGVTAVTNPKGDVLYGAGHVAGPKCAPHGSKTAGVTAGRKQAVTVNRPKDTYGSNDSYRNSDRNNYLK